MRIFVFLSVVSTSLAGLCMGQDRAAALPAFEAATVRFTAPGDVPDAQWSKPGGGIFAATNVSLELLTAMAYGIDAKQIKGAPAWFSSKHFDLNARAEPGVVLTREALKPRLQSLLQQRFHLTAHHATINSKGFVLVVAKHGPKLTASKGDRSPNFRIDVGPGKLQGTNWSMEFCALMLSPKAGLPVIDKTGLPGRYDIDVEYAPSIAEDSPLPSLTTAIEERLGLKLIAQIVPVDVLVIDEVAEVPTEN